jgi:RNA polymerase sigma-70 factor (ECF subfamily)
MAESSELSAQIDLALTKLPDKLRAVIILHDIEDMPYEEIARVVSCPVGTVKSRLFHARVRLREHLTAYVKG